MKKIIFIIAVLLLILFLCQAAGAHIEEKEVGIVNTSYGDTVSQTF